MSTRRDVDTFLSFLQWTFVDQGVYNPVHMPPPEERDFHLRDTARESDATLVCATHAVTCG